MIMGIGEVGDFGREKEVVGEMRVEGDRGGVLGGGVEIEGGGVEIVEGMLDGVMEEGVELLVMDEVRVGRGWGKWMGGRWGW